MQPNTAGIAAVRQRATARIVDEAGAEPAAPDHVARIAPPADPDIVSVAGLDVAACTADAFAALLLDRARMRRGGYVVTLNLEHLARAEHDPAYAEVLRAADIRCPDGAPVHWACRLAGGEGSERIAGVDLLATLVRAAGGLRIAIIGGRDPVRALDRLGMGADRLCYLDAGVILTDAVSLERCATEVARAAPDLIFVALGIPRQDIVGLALRKAVPGAVIVGVGGSFEMLAGIRPRAPRWVQRMGLEWLFRFSLEPMRLFPRYFLTYPIAVRRLIRWALFERKPMPKSGVAVPNDHL